jgi:uncharacterized protein (TIGR02680 family)
MSDQDRGPRFRPSRAGVINLWDYRDEEFVFVGGWLVLRGPNGSGKTKALEVLFPYVLDGRIEPRRLNPFASEERTMKSNLLYRGQEVSHAYAWMEFQRPARSGSDADTGGEVGQFVTIGIGLRAHRHVDKVTRWHFVVDGRVGVDFSLIDADDRPLNRRDLISQLGVERVYDSPEEYRRAVDARLFGLGPARYEQLLDLVLTLRKPQLAKDLNPVELSRTLQRGLRPLEDALIVEAATSFDDMEAVARTLEGLVAADQATAAFLSVYSTYLRTHARAAADALTARRQASQQRHLDVDREIEARRAAERAHRQATDRVAEAEGEPGRLRAHLDSLKASTAYQSHEQLAGLQRHVQDLAAAAGRAQAGTAIEKSTLDNRQRELTGAEAEAADATAAVTRLVTELASEAESAGIPWVAADAEPVGLATRLSARVTARLDDVRAVREHAARLAQAERDHAKASLDASAASAATAQAEQDEQSAEVALAASRSQAREAVTAWCDAHATLLDTVTTADVAAALAAAADHAGEPVSPTLKEVLTGLAAEGVGRVRDEAAALAARRDGLVERRRALAAERDRIAAEHDDAPAAVTTRPAARDERAGAPLWRLVDFADSLSDEHAAAVEAALEAAGLLDAWIHPDPALTSDAVRAAEQDGYLFALPGPRRPAGHTLADLLVAERQDAVATDVITAVLASVAVLDRLDTGGLDTASAPTAISTAGQYAQGVLLGAFVKPAPEYIGTTARATRRAARVAECKRLIAALDGEITAVDRRRTGLLGTISALAEAERALPSVAPVHAAVRELDRRATVLRLRREAETAATARLDQAIAEQAAAGGALRRIIAERSLTANRVDAVADAVRRFESAGQRVEPARRAAGAARDAFAAARTRRDEAVERLEQAESAAHEAAQRHHEKLEAFETLSASVDDADVHRVVAQVAETEQEITLAEARLARLRTEHSEAVAAHAACGARVEAAEEALRIARAEAHHESLRLRPYAHGDLLSLLRCPTDLRWPAQPDTGDGPARDALPAEVTALHEAILEATRELTPTESSLKQSATRLTSAFTELLAQLPAAGLDHRPELDTDDGVIAVRVADEQGRTPVAHFAERIARERREQEQLLSDAERRILEDALLTQLARQIHHRTIEARDLVEGMDVQMRARRMSSGLTVGVGWQLSDDLDADQREACRLLDRDPARLGPAQLATLRRHFATRIKAARAMAPEQPYRELLAQVLDYRQWRIFAFTLHRPGGDQERLTRARHSQLSGGEQSVSLHLPLFAAANALFSSAGPGAPRMLGLDEAFAGVDEKGRGELMSLATQFDLDLFMTGFDLWATHPAVTGAAHYDLSHSAVEHTVATVLLAWNGSVTTGDFDGTLARALGSPETRRVRERALPTHVGPTNADTDAELELELG